uniref:Transferrin-like domain-containing protein n=1 Tax=Steinernema glaseri TaxID=37863 RepID=A0A1I8AKH7_9BILA
GGVAPGAFEHIVKETYKTSGCNVDLFSRGWELITNMSKSAEGCKKLNTIFHIDPKTPIRNSSDAESLIEYIQNGIDYMAMTDYPYPSSFLTSMPGWPVEAACKGLQGKKTDNEILQGIFQAAMVYYNSSKTNPIQSVCLRNCESSATSSLGSFDGWDWQECTEILIEMCSTGPPNDFYSNNSNTCTNGSFNVSSFADGCVKEFGKDFKKDYVKVDKVARLYGLNMRAHSRIIFTNTCTNGSFNVASFADSCVKEFGKDFKKDY